MPERAANFGGLAAGPRDALLELRAAALCRARRAQVLQGAEEDGAGAEGGADDTPAIDGGGEDAREGKELAEVTRGNRDEAGARTSIGVPHAVRDRRF